MSTPAPLELQAVGIVHDGAARATPVDVSFTVHAGEVVLLLGPSGSGKSTLTLAMNGLVPQAVPATLDGSVRVAGLDTADTAVGKLSEHVAMVFQDPDAQIVTGTVLDEVCFGPENQLLSAEVVLQRAEKALRQVGLWERRAENPDRLSGGGRQRLTIACALAMGSPLLVLDEPTANLDPTGIDEVYAVLRGLAADATHSIVLVEHNLDAAIDIVDRVIVLDRGGRLVIDGPARAVLQERTDELLELGVWLPVSTLAAIRLTDAGIPVHPLPLTPAELAAALDAIEVLPEPHPAPADDASPATSDADQDTPGAAPAIGIRNLSLTRGGRGGRRSGTPSRHGREVVHDVSLDVEAGDFLAIVGTNGAGKTTLLQAIAGVATPPRGRIDVLGLDPATTDARTLSRTVGFVFQNPEHQFITHTVREELDHGLRVQGVADGEHGEHGERRGRVDEMLRRFGLEEHAEQHPFLLSGGQKRRLSVGTALIAGAPVLALDEPTFGQDRERAAELLNILASLNHAGTTVLVVTHDLQLVADYASHIAVMADGRLLGHGRTSEVLGSDLIERAGLRLPPLARAMRAVRRHPEWNGITRLAELPLARVIA